MIVFENDGEIDPRLITLIGVNVKESDSAIGYFGTGLKYAVACLARWGEEMVVQSGVNEFRFSSEEAEIRGAKFGVLTMMSRIDRMTLGFTTDLGKNWEPWMVYRELWCNAHDETAAKVYRTDTAPVATAGKTRVIVEGPKILDAHFNRNDFILAPDRVLLHKVGNLEVYEGEGQRIFYRGIAVQKPDKPSIFTYNITGRLTLTEDRTAATWETDWEITRGLTQLEDAGLIDTTLMAPAEKLESRLDYCHASSPSDVWSERAAAAVIKNPLGVPTSVRNKFTVYGTQTCPTCGKSM